MKILKNPPKDSKIMLRENTTKISDKIVTDKDINRIADANIRFADYEASKTLSRAARCFVK